MAGRSLIEQGKLFIAAERERGVPDEAIMRGLLDMGWKADEIEAVLRREGTPAQVIRPQQGPQVHPFSSRTTPTQPSPKKPSPQPVQQAVPTTPLERLKAFPHSWWYLLVASTLWMLLFFGLGPETLVPTIGLLFIFAGFLSTYALTGREWPQHFCFALNGTYGGVATFTFVAWLTSFVLPAARDQLLLFMLLPAIITAGLAGEYAYHAWLGIHERITMERRVAAAVGIGTAIFVVLFLMTAVIYGIVGNGAQRETARYFERERSLAETFVIPIEKTNNTYALGILNDVLSTTPQPADLPSGSGLVGEFLLFKDMGVYTAAYGTAIADEAYHELALVVRVGPLLRPIQKQQYYTLRGRYYDNTTNLTAHLIALEAGNRRLREALGTLPEQQKESISSLTVFGLCDTEQPMTLFDAVVCRFSRASTSVGALRQAMNQLSIWAGTLVMSREETFKVVPADTSDIIVLKREAERTYLQQVIISRIMIPSEAILARAQQDWQDAYLGPLFCTYLADAGNRSVCHARWALAYNDATLCRGVDDATQDTCRSAVVDEENRVYNGTTSS